MNANSIPWNLLIALGLTVGVTLQQPRSSAQEIPPAESPMYLLSGMEPDKQTFTLVSWEQNLNNLGVPSIVTDKLKPLAGVAFYGAPRFKLGLQSVLTPDELDEFYDAIRQGAQAHPYPNPRLPGSKMNINGNQWTLTTGQSNFVEPMVDAFTLPPGTNQLPNVYTNLFDGNDVEMPNTLPSTKLAPYNLHDGPPIVTEINQTSPTDDLLTIFQSVVAESETARHPPEGEQQIDLTNRQARIVEFIQRGIDILEGNPIPDRYYSGFPLLHYNGPNKVKQVRPIYDDTRKKVIGGDVDIHQIWYDNHIESDTALLNASEVWDVPWTMTYTIDCLSRGHDDFSPFGIFTDDPAINNKGFCPPSPICKPPYFYPGQRAGLAHYGMDQSFFPMSDGTRTVVKIKMPPGKYYHLVYTWGWRMHPPRIQSTDRATKEFPDADGNKKNLVQFEVEAFIDPKVVAKVNANPKLLAKNPQLFNPQASDAAKQYAINQIGDLAPAKRMWNILRRAKKLAIAGDYEQVIQNVYPDYVGQRAVLADTAAQAFQDWRNRAVIKLPKGVTVDPHTDLTLLFVNNTIYGQMKDGGVVDFTKWTLRAKDDKPTLKVTLYNGDHFRHGYVNVDFGGSRGWENAYKSSVKVGGSGCWFTFGRANWWVNNTGILVDNQGRPIPDPTTGQPKPSHPVWLPPADKGDKYLYSVKQAKQYFNITYNYEPSRRLRFYQFDPTHHDVCILSFH